MDCYQQVFETNERWIAKKTAQDEDFFMRIAPDQQPDFLWIGCSDSRRPANEIMAPGPGDVPVHRNVANRVDNNDRSVHTVIQYAVEYADVKYTVVCGYYGIKAVRRPTDTGLLNGWLHNVTAVYRMQYAELSALNDLNERYRRLVELTVEEQGLNVARASYRQRSFPAKKLLGIYDWVHDLYDSRSIDLKIGVQTMFNRTGISLPSRISCINRIFPSYSYAA